MAHYVCVTGGRDFDDAERVTAALEFLHQFYGDELRIMHGGARGADTLAGRCALDLGIPPERIKKFPADWKRNGKRAGHIRNAHMAGLLAKWRAAGHSVQVIAFPGGNGTSGMISEAESRGIPVDQV